MVVRRQYTIPDAMNDGMLKVLGQMQPSILNWQDERAQPAREKCKQKGLSALAFSHSQLIKNDQAIFPSINFISDDG